MDLIAYFSTSIDLYCERLGPDFWAEPVNALSNLAFIVAAIWAWRAQNRRQLVAQDLRWLTLSMGGIGLCSLAFHTMGQRWAAWLDSISILVFLLGFASTWAQRVYGWSWSRAWLAAPAAGAFIGIGTLTLLQVKSPWMRTEVAWYISTWLAITLTAALTPAMARTGQVIGRWMWATAGMFSLALLFRQLDLLVCPWWPVGTHFGWHLSNALVTALGMQALMNATPTSKTRSAPPAPWPWRVLYTLFVWGVALILLFEEWGWEPLARLLAWVGRLPGLRWIEAQIRTLPPYRALALFGIPVVALLPIKLLALYWLSHGHTLLGLAVIIAAKLGGTALTARLFMLTQPTLMRLAWFARGFERWITWKTKAIAQVRSSAAWRSVAAIRHAATQAVASVVRRVRGR
jgi:hypothetical protein